MKPFQISAKHQELMASQTDETFRCQTAGEGEFGTEVILTGIVGDESAGLDAAGFVGFLSDNKTQPVHLRINSPGGLAYDGLQIFNALLDHGPTVTATIEGRAHSAASIIAMAADQVRMHEASDFGIHRSSGLAIGNQFVMREITEWLDGLDEHMIGIYQDRTGASRDEIVSWIDGPAQDGTYFPAARAVEIGFADELIQRKKKPAPATAFADHAARLLSARKRQFLMDQRK